MVAKATLAALLGFAFALSALAQSEPGKSATPPEPAAGGKSAKPAKPAKAKEKARKRERVHKEYSRPKPRGT